MAIKFNLYQVKDTSTGQAARVFYSINGHLSGRECVSIYEKSNDKRLRKILRGQVVNGTNIQIDYFEQDRAHIFKGNPLYPAALRAAQRVEEKRIERWLAAQ